MLLSYLCVGFQVVIKHIDADSEISGIERVAAVPALGTKLEPSSNTGMEVAERKEDAFELLLSCTHLKCIL